MIRHFTQACQLLDELANNNPHATRFRAELARCYACLSMAQLKTGELKAAEQSARAAKRIQQTLPDTHVLHTTIPIPEVGDESKRHAAEKRTGDAQAELARWQQAIEHQLAALAQTSWTKEQRRLLREQFAQLAALCDALAQPDSATLAAAKHRASWPNDPVELYYVACTLARMPALLAEE